LRRADQKWHTIALADCLAVATAMAQGATGDPELLEAQALGCPLEDLRVRWSRYAPRGFAYAPPAIGATLRWAAMASTSAPGAGRPASSSLAGAQCSA
jgi:hypothetical protein